MAEGAQGRGTPRPQTLRRREHPRVGLAPLSKGAGCGESRRLGDCLEAGSRSRKAAQGGTLRVAAASGGGISGRGNPSDRAWRRGHLPLTREANCRAGLATNRETVILMLLRTRVGADSISARSAAPQTPPGRIWNPPLQWFFQCCSQPGNHDPRVTANLCRGRCLHRPAPRGGANTPGGRPLPGAAFRGRAIPPTAPGGAATSL